MSSQEPPIINKTPEKSQSPAVKVTTSAATRGNRLAPAHNNLPLITPRETAVDGNADGVNNPGSLMFSSPPVIRRHSHQRHRYLSSSHEPEEREIDTQDGTQETLSDGTPDDGGAAAAAEEIGTQETISDESNTVGDEESNRSSLQEEHTEDALTTLRQLEIAQILRDIWCNAGASERVHNNNETNGAEDTGGDDDGGSADAAAEEIDEHFGDGEQNNHHTWKLLDGVADEDVNDCFEFLEEIGGYGCEEFVSNITSDELTKYAEQHARIKQIPYKLRPMLTKARALKEKVLNDGGKDDTHLIKAIVTTQNVVVSEELNCQDICRPESWLKDHQHFGQTKGVYIAVWGRDRVFDDNLRSRFEEEFQKKEFSYLSDDAKNDIRRIFSCVRNESGRDDRLLRVKIGMILDEHLFQRMRTLHQSEGQFAQMIFIGTNDLCDDKVKELEDLLKYVCYRSSMASYSGRRMSCIAGVSSEVFYMQRNHIDFFITEAVDFH